MIDKKSVFSTFQTNRLLLCALLFSITFQVILLSLPPHHDIFYRSDLYLHNKSYMHERYDDFSTPMPRLNWSSDWRRQLLIHPPGNYSFTWLWTLIFGNSPAILGILSMITGVVGLFLWKHVYLLISNVFVANSVVAITACTVSFNWYAVMPTDAIFEFAAIPLGLIGILGKIDKGHSDKKSFGFFIFTQFTALFFSYHYLTVLVFAAIIFAFLRQYVYVITCIILATAPGIYILTNIFSGTYNAQWNHWPTKPGLTGIFYWFSSLPVEVLHYGGTGASYLLYILGCLSIIGLVSFVFSKDQSVCRSQVVKGLLSFIFVSSFLTFYILSEFLDRFGHQRNVFFLLPIFIFFIVFPFAKTKIYPVIVVSLSLLLIGIGFHYNKHKIQYLLFNYAPFTASRVFNDKCLAIETKDIFDRANAYLQSTMRYRKVRWIDSNSINSACEIKSKICASYLVFSRSELDLKCPEKLSRLSVVSHPSLVNLGLRYFTKMDSPVYVFSATRKFKP